MPAEVSYYERLLRSVADRRPAGSPLQDRSEAERTARAREASRLTHLLETHPCFSFVRLGDMDLGMLLARQDGEGDPFGANALASVNGTRRQGTPGISMRHADRLDRAFRDADYVDFHERLWPIGPLLPRLTLERRVDGHRNPSIETSYVLLTWLESEFPRYCHTHHVGFAGAESRLLELIVSDERLPADARAYWSDDGVRFFHQIRNDGRTIDHDLDAILDDLRGFVAETGIDTLFLSLGGGAKILAHELSRLCQIRVIDFGAMLRALTFSGSDGHAATRATHSPYYYRVPFGVHMDALETAFPSLTPEVLLAKAHAQLIQELQPQITGWTSTGEGHATSARQASDFQESYETYRRRYRRLFDENANCVRERQNFLHYCGERNLTGEGRRFFRMFQFKSRLRRYFRFRLPSQVGE